MVVKSYNEEDSILVERFYESVVYTVEFMPQTLISCKIKPSKDSVLDFQVLLGTFVESAP